MVHFGFINLSQVIHYYTACMVISIPAHICNSIIVIYSGKYNNYLQLYLFRMYILALVACKEGMYRHLYYSAIVGIPTQTIYVL